MMKLFEEIKSESQTLNKMKNYEICVSKQCLDSLILDSELYL